VLNNQGYASIRAMQNSRFGGHLVACDTSSGLTFPNLERIVTAYGLPFTRIVNQANLRQDIQRVINKPGTIICEVLSPPNEARQPGLLSVQRPDGTMVSRPLEELSPPLDRTEFLANMMIPPVAE
jgi:acetolactate synthase I/II/III large subunit